MKKLIILLAMLATSHAGFTQKAKANSEKNKSNTVIVTEGYSCPMHPDIKSDKPGKCSICGMDLLRSEKEKLKRQTVKLYSCPMHPEITSNKPGKCSKCGMNLNLSSKEKMKMEVMKIYACPMHPEVTADKPGKCPKCGMDLKEKEKEKDKSTKHKH
ncbi:MAG: heavy metal-binding domain-containing protein [Sphingobacteriales bacterium]